MPRVLVVEDERKLLRGMQRGLEAEGYEVVTAASGEAAEARLAAQSFDCLVLDWMLPGRDGIAILTDLRRAGDRTPVLLLTARDTVEDRVWGLDVGADDYLVKPFAFPELVARLRALLRRPPLQMDPVLHLRDLEMDTARREVRRSGRLIELSPREFTLLEYLMRHPRHVLTRTQLAEHVWNFDFFSDSN